MAATTVQGRARRSPQDLIASDRIHFLCAEPLDPRYVRSPIFSSWQRSKDFNVTADRIHQEHTADVDGDTPITRSANPVLRNLRLQLDDQPMSIILTDATGLVLSRQSGDDQLDRYLDSIQLAPGFRYAEENVGTNGIGMALEVGGPAYVFGHEHYAENLEELSCVGVPIRHPISGRTVAVLDLTCWTKDAGPLLLTLAKNTAEQIRQALLAGAGAQQLELLQEYLRTCRRLPGIVFAVTGDTVILNEQARTMLDPLDQASLLAHAGESLTGGQRQSIQVELPSGAFATMYGRPVGEQTLGRGAVIHVKMGPPAVPERPAHHTTVRMQLPGLVGSDPVWLRACREVETASRTGEWLALSGEAGVGKLALLQAVQLRHQPVRRVTVLDGAGAHTDPDWSSAIDAALDGPHHGLVVRHVDALEGPRLRELTSALGKVNRTAGENHVWVAVTLGRMQGHRANRDLTALMALFPKTVVVPPLRLHLGDMPALVSFFLGRLGPNEQLTCSPEAMATLARGAWPGNAQEVLDVLRDVIRHRRTGTIQLDDLPPGVRTVSRRRLSLIEAMERDAVVQSLIDSNGDKTKAAISLGMSRATIYRKIHDFGIVVSPR